MRAVDPGCASSQHADSSLVYSVKSSGVSVGRRTGDVCLTAALDYDTTSLCEINVTATDRGRTTFYRTDGDADYIHKLRDQGMLVELVSPDVRF